MTQTEEEIRGEAAGHEGRFCLCESYARVTERAALAGARWLGRADQQTAEDDASTAMRLVLEQLPIDGNIVIGAGGDADHLATGQRVGSGGLAADLALDPLEESRAAGARIKLIQDGDVTASISAAIRGTNDHLAVGIGGTRQAVLSAAALRCLGGELQAQLWPTSRREIEQARDGGVEDVERLFAIEDLAPGEVIGVATGVSNGDLL